MMQVRALVVVVLAGCTAVNPPPEPQANATSPPRIAHKARVAAKVVAPVVHPLNCGTPDDYKICPLPVRQVISSEELADLSPIPQGRVEVQELTPLPPLPTLTADQLAQALPPIPPPKAPTIVEPPPPTLLSQTLIRLRDE